MNSTIPRRKAGLERSSMCSPAAEGSAFFGSRPDREERRCAVLGLDGDDLAHRLDRVGAARSRQPLGAEPVAAGRGRVQAACSSDFSPPAPGSCSAVGRGGSRRETTFDTPLPAIDTP